MRSLGILFGSRLLLCRANKIMKVIMLMTLVVMVMIVMMMSMVMVTARIRFPNSIYHNSQSTAPWRRYG